jgi:hypothetical protein
MKMDGVSSLSRKETAKKKPAEAGFAVGLKSVQL